MPRVARQAPGGYVYHVINRAVGRMTLFRREGDYEAFERTLAQTQQRHDMRLLAWCVMPNHWHLVVWPRRDGEMGRFMQRLTVTHVRRWQEHRRRVGEGHVYQGRYKSFPCQSDEHLLRLCRYVERNALRSGLVDRAEDWRWGSLWRWRQRARALDDVPELTAWPLAGVTGSGRPRNWAATVNKPETDEELAALRRCVVRGQPLGGDAWVKRITTMLGLESTFRPPGRPRKAKPHDA